MRFTVGGRSLDLTLEQVAHAMQSVEPEPIRTHLVEMHNTVFPPKQVLATVTGWDRDTFTTYEAQRVLARLGFLCRRAGTDPSGRPSWVREDDEINATPTTDERLSEMAAAIGTLQAAVAGLNSRVAALESDQG
ncbi:MAG TPA: hypothetical protein VF519_04650 [Mycobacteriales bacterium]|jgi:hypothetical protein